MNISAVFAVHEITIKEMIEKEECKRLDYLLGLENNRNFEENLIDMEDFTDTPANFYSLLQKEYSFLKHIKMSCMYKSAQHSIYTLTAKEVENLNKLFRIGDEKYRISAFSCLKLHQVDTMNSLSAYTLTECAMQFKSLIISTKTKGSCMLFVFKEK